MEVIFVISVILFTISIIGRRSRSKNRKSNRLEGGGNTNRQIGNPKKLKKVSTDNISFECNPNLEPYFMIVDTETNGLPLDFNATYKNLSNWPEILQLSYLMFSRNGILVKEVNHYIKLDSSLDSQAFRIHGISKKLLDIEGKDPDFVYQEFAEDLIKSKYLVAHNISFDSKMIKSNLERFNFNPTKIFRGKHLVCTMRLTTEFVGIRRRYGDYKYPKLSELYGKLFYNRTDIKYDGMHDALNDVFILSQSFFELMRLNIIDLRSFQIKDDNKAKVKQYLKKDKEIRSFHLVKKNLLHVNEISSQLEFIEDLSKYVQVLSSGKLQSFDYLELLINLTDLEIREEVEGKDSYNSLATKKIGVTEMYRKANYGVGSIMIKIARDYFSYYADVQSLKFVLKAKTYHPATGLENNYKFLECVVNGDIVVSINIDKIDPTETIKLFKPKMKFLKTKGFQLLE